MDYNQLRAAVIAYSTRDDLTDLIDNTFLPIAEARIGRDLETQENEAQVTLSPTENVFALPSDFGKLIGVEYLQDRGPKTLTSRDIYTINKFSSQGGTPHVYYMRKKMLDVRPFVAGDYRVTYYARPELSIFQPTNEVAARYPNIYLQAWLAELYIYERDAVKRDEALGVYTADVRRANADARRARSNKPAMRRA